MNRELFCNINIDYYPLIHNNLPVETRVMNIDPDDVNQSVQELLYKVKIKLDSPGWLYCDSSYITYGCHVDGNGDVYRHNNDWYSLCKLNYVIGGPNVSTCWYDVPDNMLDSVKKVFTSTRFPYWVFEASKCKMIESKVMQGWHLFDAGVPHNIVNHKSEQRWNATFIIRDIDTNKWLTFTEAKQRMSSIGLC